MSGAATLTIYWVDDEPVQLQVLKCADLSWDAHCFQNLIGALQSARPDALDIVISDMNMLEMCGSDHLETMNNSAPHAMRFLLPGSGDYVLTKSAHQDIAKPVVYNESIRKISNSTYLAHCRKGEDMDKAHERPC
jgi:DNA-binding NtrC family response regulator